MPPSVTITPAGCQWAVDDTVLDVTLAGATDFAELDNLTKLLISVNNNLAHIAVSLKTLDGINKTLEHIDEGPASGSVRPPALPGIPLPGAIRTRI